MAREQNSQRIIREKRRFGRNSFFIAHFVKACKYLICSTKLHKFLAYRIKYSSKLAIVKIRP